jgi:hypothetical protein
VAQNCEPSALRVLQEVQVGMGASVGEPLRNEAIKVWRTGVLRCGRSMVVAMVPPRIRIAAVLLGLFGIGLIAYTVILTVPLLADPDPMAGLEFIVSAILVVGALGALAAGLGLLRSAAWARPLAIGVALLLIIVAAAFIGPNLGSIGGYGPTLIDPLFWILGAVGLVLLSLVLKPYQ